MVARDGIEPPTPAFSGPRSTTELPGLSADFQLHLLRGSSFAGERWKAPRTVLCNDLGSIPTDNRARQTLLGREGRSSQNGYLLAMLSLTELNGISIVPTLRDPSS
jgi:hypothetical protein